MKRVSIFAAALVLTLGAGVRAGGEKSLSAAPATTLTAQLEQLKLDVIAARDPEEPGRYVAALYIPGIQLLVISTPYPLTAAIDKKIAAGQYMDVYVDMQAVRDRKGQFFVQDVLADGLSPASDPQLASDTTTLDGVTVAFNGAWTAQQLTQDEYTARFQRDDERYARLLKVLSAALRLTVP